jgi:predicted PurR-regulated permease PerM
MIGFLAALIGITLLVICLATGFNLLLKKLYKGNKMEQELEQRLKNLQNSEMLETNEALLRQIAELKSKLETTNTIPPVKKGRKKND